MQLSSFEDVGGKEEAHGIWLNEEGQVSDHAATDGQLEAAYERENPRVVVAGRQRAERFAEGEVGDYIEGEELLLSGLMKRRWGVMFLLTFHQLTISRDFLPLSHTEES